MEALLAKYDTYLKEVKHASVNTLTSYIKDVSKYLDFLRLEKIVDIKSTNTSILKKYIASLEANGLSGSTIARNISSIKSFYKFLNKNGFSDVNPADLLDSITIHRKTPEILSYEQINELLNVPDTTTLIGCRDLAMLETMYATGIRVSELIALNVEDINTSMGFIRCIAAKQERIIPIHKIACKAIDKYISNARPKLLCGESYNCLFLNSSGRRLSRQGFWKILKYYSGQIDFNIQITPNTLRHSFAIHLLENGADSKTIQELLGYSSSASTKIYEKIVEKKLNSVYKKAHPRANFENYLN